MSSCRRSSGTRVDAEAGAEAGVAEVDAEGAEVGIESADADADADADAGTMPWSCWSWSCLNITRSVGQ
jgi:hypothetical protein